MKKMQQVANVDPTAEHFELRYGSLDDGGWNDWLPVALVGRPVDGVFPVQFLIDRNRADQSEITADVINEIKFYLIEKGEPDPWTYAQYHFTTASNLYSRVHWAFIPSRDLLREK